MPRAIVKPQEMLIVTGMSGAGRSTVGNALEDLGWYVVDNLPPQMLRPLVELGQHAGEHASRDRRRRRRARGQAFSWMSSRAIEALRDNAAVRVLFLDATDAALVRRFEPVRRPHPLQGDGTLLDGIADERTRMAEIRRVSDMIIDTSELNIHQLATTITERFAEAGCRGARSDGNELRLQVRPADRRRPRRRCRFLPNPFWIPEAASRSRARRAVSRSTCSSQPGASEFVDAYAAALGPCLAGYQRENKRHATIAIGCTGGKHRSVAIAEELAALLETLPGVAVSVKHRDLGRE